MVGNEANTCHMADEEMENVSDSENDCQILNITSETPPSAEKNKSDTNAELAASGETTPSDKNVVPVEGENHEIDTYIQSRKENSVSNLDSIKHNVLGLGKEFETEEQAYLSYLEYATLEGFCIRKDFINKDYDGIIRSQRFTCYKEGHRHPKRGSKPKKPREDTRTGCLAHMTISLRPNGKYRVMRFEADHNHELDNLLPSQNIMNLDDNIESIEDEAPKVGMRFNSEDHAYEYYSTYALLAGFSIRKDYVNRSKKDGEVSSRKFTCCRGGSNNNTKNESSSKRARKETRIGCLAHLIVVRHPDRMYHVAHYEGNHNHELIPACTIRTLRSQKRLALAHCVEEAAAIDMPMVDTEREYNPIDTKSTLPRKRKSDMKEGESETIVQYFSNRKKKDPTLFYSIQLDSEGQMANIFWVDAKMIEDYHFFGDVVCYDTSYKLDKDCRPFVSFTGINNHKQLLIFGTALMYDSTFESLEWLFRMFLRVMAQKKPKTILTDQNSVIVEVIDLLFPDANHRLCAWHMHQKALKSIDQETQDSEFSADADDLKSLFFNFEEEKDFVEAWETMVEKSNLWHNEVFTEIFREREKWAMPYGRHIFCADMKCAQIADHLLPKVRKYIKSSFDILSCLNQFLKLLKDWRYNEIQANYDMSDQLPRLMGDIILLKRVRDIYTPTIFELFQKEYEKFLDSLVNQCNDNEATIEFKVGRLGDLHEYTVMYSLAEDSVACSCMKFEFEGILCSHSMKVLDYRNIKVVPTQYVLKRWSKSARI